MKKIKFIGRKRELTLLKNLTAKKSASLVVVQGRRRIGKSRLIEEFGKNYRFLSFSSLPPRKSFTNDMQLNYFIKQFNEISQLPSVSVNDWYDLFLLLANETKEGRVVILLDEISWMGSKDPNFLGKLKNAWDMKFKQNPELILILCGSVSSWIEKNILNSTGFMGRISLRLFLKELSLMECNEFFNEIGFRGSEFDKLKILSLTGGIPRYIEEIRSNLSAEANINELCFQPNGVLFREFNDIFSDLFSRKSNTYKEIIRSLINGKKEIKEISKEIGIANGGYLSECLFDLTLLGFIKRDYLWSINTSKESKLGHYRLSDNYLRFYLKNIDPYKSRIENNNFGKNFSLIHLPMWDSIMGLQFENLVLFNNHLLTDFLSITPMDIVNCNPFVQKKGVRKKGCQIDYLIQTRFNNLFVCEIKFSKNKINSEIINEVKEKISKLYLPKGYSFWPVLIHVNGVTDEVKNSEYFSHIIDFSEMLYS
jgi:uncharacterized protein